jgi:hypothetical protein
MVAARMKLKRRRDEFINRRGGWAKALGEIKADFPNAVRFERVMEQKEYK